MQLFFFQQESSASGRDGAAATSSTAPRRRPARSVSRSNERDDRTETEDDQPEDAILNHEQVCSVSETCLVTLVQCVASTHLLLFCQDDEDEPEQHEVKSSTRSSKAKSKAKPAKPMSNGKPKAQPV